MRFYLQCQEKFLFATRPRKSLGNVKFLFHTVFKSLKEFSGKFQFLFFFFFETTRVQSFTNHLAQALAGRKHFTSWGVQLWGCGVGFITSELCGSVSGKVISIPWVLKTEAAVLRLLLTLQGNWNTLSFTRFLGLEPVGIAPTATIPELSASLFLLIIGPFQDIILALSFHWSQGTRIYKKANAEKRDLHEWDLHSLKNES